MKSTTFPDKYIGKSIYTFRILSYVSFSSVLDSNGALPTLKTKYPYKASNRELLGTIHRLFHRRSLLSQFREVHSLEFHRKFVFDWIKELLLNWRINGPAKVANLQHVKAVENVFRFDIAMDHTIAMKIPNSACDLSEIIAGIVLGEVVFCSDFSKKTAVSS